MLISEFRKDFLEQIVAQAVTEGNFRRSAFVDACARLLEEAEEVADFEHCYHRGTGSRNKIVEIDGFAFDDADGSARLFVADYKGSDEEETLTQTQAKATFSRLQAFCEEALSGRLHKEVEESSPASSLASSLFNQRASITRLRFYLLTDAAMSSRIRDWPEASIANIPTEFHIWDINRFHRAFDSQTGKDELEVDFAELVTGGISCLPASVKSDEYATYLCVLPGTVLADIYDRFGSRLLEGNVRSFLTIKGRVNRGIRQTIMTLPEMFFSYNNGIACTASAVEVGETTSGMSLLKVTDLQIVNGGQTTASLSAARHNDKAALDRIFVPMKLSVVPHEVSGQVIPVIARCANTQNRVSEADFFSNHEFHRRMEQISRRIWAPATDGAQYETHWFYERARGQYLNAQAKLTPSERKRFGLLHPRAQVITKTDLAKYDNAWRQHPHTVSLGAQKNFLAFSTYATNEWERNSDQFNEEYFKRLVAKGVLFRRTEQLVSKQPWYQGGYRANIVVYAIAKLSHLIATEAPSRALDFRSIWNRQGLTPALESEITRIAESVLEIIVNPPAGLQNVTEWCKKELCWKRVADLEMVLSSAVFKELIERDEEVQRTRDSKEAQKIETGIEKQTIVFQLGAPYWKALRDWGIRESLLSPEDISFLSVAVAIPRKLPSEKQSSRLMEIKSRMESEGYPAQNAEVPQ